MHWSENPYWRDALNDFYAFREAGKASFTLDLAAIEKAALQGSGPAYLLMEAMLSVKEQEAMDGFRGAPRVMLALLMRLHEISVNTRT